MKVEPEMRGLRRVGLDTEESTVKPRSWKVQTEKRRPTGLFYRGSCFRFAITVNLFIYIRQYRRILRNLTAQMRSLAADDTSE